MDTSNVLIWSDDSRFIEHTIEYFKGVSTDLLSFCVDHIDFNTDITDILDSTNYSVIVVGIPDPTPAQVTRSIIDLIAKKNSISVLFYSIRPGKMYDLFYSHDGDLYTTFLPELSDIIHSNSLPLVLDVSPKSPNKISELFKTLSDINHFLREDLKAKCG